MNYKKILVVLPHPDDEVFPTSGTLSAHIQEGSHVTYACLTLGEMGRNLGNPAFANRVTLPEVRRQELLESVEVIGIQELILLGYHDKTVEFEPFDDIDQVLSEIVERVQPDLIYTYHPKHGVHPDHNACGAAMIRVVSRMAPDLRPPVRCCAFPAQELGPADVVNDITPFLNQKLGSLRAHKSQFQAYVDMDVTKAENKEFLDRISKERFWLYKF